MKTVVLICFVILFLFGIIYVAHGISTNLTKENLELLYNETFTPEHTYKYANYIIKCDDTTYMGKFVYTIKDNGALVLQDEQDIKIVIKTGYSIQEVKE